MKSKLYILFLFISFFISRPAISQVSILENDYLKFEDPNSFLIGGLMDINSLTFQNGFDLGQFTPTSLVVGNDLVNSRLTSEGLLTKEYAVIPGSESRYGMHNLIYRTDFSNLNYHQWIMGNDPFNDDAGFSLQSEIFDIDLIINRTVLYSDPSNGYLGVGGGHLNDIPEEPLDVYGNARIRNSLFILDNGEFNTTGEIFYGEGPKYGMGGSFDLNPAVQVDNVGHIFESKHGTEGQSDQSSGIYLDGDEVSIWAPGDNNRLLRVWNEAQSLERFYVNASGVAFTVSDMQLKKNIGAIDKPLEKLSMLRGISYEYTSTKNPVEGYEESQISRDTRHIGVIAQEVEKIFPELVSTNEHGYKFVNYDGLIPVLIEAVKEQQKMIDNLNKKVDSLAESIKHSESAPLKN